MNALAALEENRCTVGIGEPNGGGGSGEDGSRKEGDDGEELGSDHSAGFERWVD